jgi:Histidine kinase-, DNA gyrase B-, and HSP90-like ATPase
MGRTGSDRPTALLDASLMEGPYRDLGAGFARLTGVEGLRRSPRRLRSVEDALVELLRNARDAGARNVYVASSLRARRYRALTVIDDGRGIPETHKRLIFEPGVTTRHLRPVEDRAAGSAHGAGLSLHHIKNAAVSAEVCSSSSPTSLRVVFDTEFLPERSLQSNSRHSGSNLPATLAKFVQAPNAPRLYHASPARILARLLKNRIIRWSEGTGLSERVRQEAEALGLEVSSRTVQRVLGGEVEAAGEVAEGGGGERGGRTSGRVGGRRGGEGPILSVGEGELAEIGAVLRRAARASYLELSGLVVEKRAGEIVVRARVYEPEEEYE